MQRLNVLGALLVVLVIVPSQALAADTWCWTNHPDAIFCEDFDRYCSNPPPYPQRCDPPGEDIRDTWAMWALWDTDHNCGWSPAVHDEFASSYPYSAKIGCQPWNNELGYGNTGLTSYIRDKFGTDYSEVRATDATPLTMEYSIYGGPKVNAANLYLELGRGRASILLPDENSITNWTISDDCRACGDTAEQAQFPIICRQSPTPNGCADISTATVVPAIAVGIMSFLDANPCHCGETGDHWPYATRIAFFNGLQWYTLRKGLFPDPGGSEPAPGDFLLTTGSVHHRIRLIIKSATVTIEMRVGSVLSRCEVPRAYMGCFTSMLMGYQTPCQVTPGTWTCNGALDCNGPCGPVKTCCVSGAPGGGTVPIDDIALYGGQGCAEQGACCFPDKTCTEAIFQGDCSLLGGDPAAPGSTCPETACCPPLPADQDLDGDVDVEDFGWFQLCLSSAPYAPPPTVPCRCADLDNDADVDISDLTVFTECMLGPGIQADPHCAD